MNVCVVQVSSGTEHEQSVFRPVADNADSA